MSIAGPGLVSTNLGDGLIDRANRAVGKEAASSYYVSLLSHFRLPVVC